MQVDTSVAEADVGKLQPGMARDLHRRRLPGERFKGNIRQIRNAAQTVQNVVTYDAVIDVENPDLKLKPGHDGQRHLHLRRARRRARGAQRRAALPAAAGAARRWPAARRRRAAAPRTAAPRRQRRPRARGARRLAAPAGAAARAAREQRKTVYVLRDGKPAPVQRDDSASPTAPYTEVVEGELKEGDAVITDVDHRRRSRGARRRARRPAAWAAAPRRLAVRAVAGAGAEMSATTPLIVSSRTSRKVYRMGDVEVRALAASTSTIERGEFVAIMGASRLGQVDADEHPRLPRPAHRRAATCSTGAEVARLVAQRAGRVAQPDPRLRVPELQPARAHQRARERGAAARLRGRARARSGSARAPRGARARGPGRAAGPPPEPALRRPAAARGHRARAGERAAAHPRRRAHRQPRLAHQHRGHGALPGARPRRASPSSSSRTSRTSPSTPSRVVRGEGRAACAPTSARRRVPAVVAPPSRGGRVMNAARDLARGAPRAAAQQDALVPHHARHHHRRRRGHRDGGHRRGRQGQVEEAFAAMGTNLLIVLPGSSSHGRRRAAASARSPRSPGTTSRPSRPRCPSVRARRAGRCAPTRSVRQRGPELDDAASRAPRPSTSTSAAGPWPAARASPSRTSTAATKVVVLGPDGGREALRRRAPTRSGRRCASATCPSRSSAWLAKKGQSADGPGLRRRASSSRRPPSSARSRAASASTSPARSSCSARARRRPPSARRRTSPRCSATATTCADGADDDFSIRNLAEIASAQQQGTETMTTLLASIAAVSLLVGGIGIMNIMLVSVTERTREIGMRMAIGAQAAATSCRSSSIEALTLSIAGGLIGVGARRRRGAACCRDAVRLADADPARRHRRLGGVQRAGRHRASGSTRRARRRSSIPSTRCGTSDDRPRPAASARRPRHPGSGQGAHPDEAVRVAQERQPLLTQARANTQAAQARADEARAPLLPQVGLSASSRLSPAAPRPPCRATSPPRPPATRCGATSPPAAPLGLRPDVEPLRSRRSPPRRRSRPRSAPPRLQTILNVEVAYFAARAQKELVAVARETLANQSRHLEQVQGFVTVGTHAPIDLAQARTDLANAKVQLINAENGYAHRAGAAQPVHGRGGRDRLRVADSEFPALAQEGAPFDKLMERGAVHPAGVHRDRAAGARAATGAHALGGAYLPASASPPASPRQAPVQTSWRGTGTPSSR